MKPSLIKSITRTLLSQYFCKDESTDVICKLSTEAVYQFFMGEASLKVDDIEAQWLINSMP